MTDQCRYCGEFMCENAKDCRAFLAERVASLQAGLKSGTRAIEELSRERDTLEAKVASLQDRLEDALEIVHGEGRLDALNAKLAAMRAQGLAVPYPLITLQERAERAEAERDEAREATLVRKLPCGHWVSGHVSSMSCDVCKNLDTAERRDRNEDR